MHNQQNYSHNSTVKPRSIRFWSTGKIANSAYERIEKLKSLRHTIEAEAMLSEWRVD